MYIYIYITHYCQLFFVKMLITSHHTPPQIVAVAAVASLEDDASLGERSRLERTRG